MAKFFQFWVAFFVCLVFVAIADSSDWKELKKDEPVPPGSDVRMDLETGARFVRPLEGEAADRARRLYHVDESSVASSSDPNTSGGILPDYGVVSIGEAPAAPSAEAVEALTRFFNEQREQEAAAGVGDKDKDGIAVPASDWSERGLFSCLLMLPSAFCFCLARFGMIIIRCAVCVWVMVRRGGVDGAKQF